MSDLVTVARGDTYHVRGLLSDWGFVWHAEDKTWRRDPPLSDEDQEIVRRCIRRTSAANFDASKVEVRNIRKSFLA